MTTKQIHIEKYDFNGFEKQGEPYVMVRTKIIQQMLMKYAKEYLLWSYLQSLPPTWIPNIEHITKHFKISYRTYERYMAFLNGVGLIAYRQNRLADGSFGQGTLIVLDGEKFNLAGATKGTVTIGGSAVNKKKEKVIHNINTHRTANFGETETRHTTHASIGFSENSPNRQITEVRLDDVHINTINRNIKEREKTNRPVSVFSCAVSVQTHLTAVLANRQTFVEPLVIEEGIFYAFETNPDKSFDSVNKRLNIFLKKVREGKWLTPQGFQGISSQSIREKEEQEQKDKQKQYEKDAAMFRELTRQPRPLHQYQTIHNPNIEYYQSQETKKPRNISEGLRGFSALAQSLRASMGAHVSV